MKKRGALLRAIEAVRERLAELEEGHDTIECVAEGQLQVALHALESAANLLGED